MVFTKALALKVMGGTLFLGSASTGIYLINDHLKNQLTIYDQALIDHLEKGGGDIKFAVLNGSGATQLSAFPTTFDSNTQTATVTVKVKVGGTAETTEGTITPGTNATGDVLGTVNYLKKISGTEKEWTWTCEINFTRDADSSSASELDDTHKERVMKDSKGLFNKLKTESGSDTKNKKLKQDFIRNCGHARTRAENRKINNGNLEAENVVKTPKEKINFKLKKGEVGKPWGTATDKLFFTETDKFDKWFPKEEAAQ